MILRWTKCTLSRGGLLQLLTNTLLAGQNRLNQKFCSFLEMSRILSSF